MGINDDEDDEEDEEEAGPKFKVLLEKAEPAQVKISKKNCCTVELLKTSNKNTAAANEYTKMIEFFM